MMRAKFDSYPVRPVMRVGESLQGYLCRFYFSNGHEVSSEARALLESIRGGYVGEAQLSALREMTGAERIAAGIQFEIMAAGMVLKAGDGVRCKSAHLAYCCPDCIAEGSGHQALANMPLVDACPTHALLLVSSCTDCGDPLSWTAMRGSFTCRCGTYIGAMRRETAAAWQCDFATWLQVLAAEQAGIAKEERSNPYRKLVLALELRNLVVGGRDLARFLGAAPFAPQVRRRAPGRWETALLREPVQRLVVRAKRLLRRTFSGDQSLLLVPNSGRLEAILDVAKRWGEPAERSIVNLRQAIAEALGAYRVTPARIDVIFNPAIRQPDREAHLAALAAWWQMSRSQLEIPELDRDLRAVSSHRDYSLALEILNSLVHAAVQGREIASLRAFRAHWFPSSAFRNVDGSIDSFVEAVGGLHAAELGYMGALLQQDLAQGVGQHHG